MWTRDKELVLIGCFTWHVLPSIWSLTAVNATFHTKGKLFITFLTSLSAHISFSQLSGIFLTKKQLTCLQKLFFMSHKSIRQQPPTPNFKCLVPKHVTSGTLWEHDFLLRVHTSMQPRVVVKTFFSILALPYTLSAHSLPLSTKRFQHLFSNKSITNQQRW